MEPAVGVGVAVVLAELVEVVEEDDASRAACAATRLAWATVTARASEPVLMVARTCPAVTWSPTPTLTDVTMPAVRNVALTWSTRAMDPDSEMDWVTEPLLTVAVRSPVVEASLLRASKVRYAVAPTRATPQPAAVQRIHRPLRRGSATAHRRGTATRPRRG